MGLLRLPGCIVKALGAPAQRPPHERARAAGWLLALFLIAALGFAARLVTWSSVYTSEGVELFPYDSHYYVRFAGLQLESFPRFTGVDPLVSFPTRPRIIWPPLHAGLVAGALSLAGVSRFEEAAAWVDPSLSLLWLAGLGLFLLRTREGTEAFWATAVLALTPASIVSSSLGNADHHVHEPYLHALLGALTLLTLRHRSVRWAASLGLCLGLARSFTTVGALWTPLVAVAFLLSAALGRRDEAPARLALVTGAAYSLVAAVTTAALGTLGNLQYELQGGFQVLFGLAAFVGAAAGAGALARAWRWTLFAPLALALLFPISSELLRALAHVGAADPLLAVVTESRPLLTQPRLAIELAGPALVFVFAFAAVAVARFPDDPAGRLEGLLVAAWLLVGTALAATQARFANLWVGGAALATAFVVNRVGTLGLDPAFLRRALRALAVLGALWTLTRLRPADGAFPPTRARLGETLEWLRGNSAPGANYGVLAHLEYGHLVNLWAERASIASTFSQAPWHVEANERAANVLRLSEEAAAYEACRRERVRYVLATPAKGYLHFPDPKWKPRLLRMLHDPPGRRQGAAPTFAHFRLVHESSARTRPPSDLPWARLYEVVEGALVTGPCSPLAGVTLVGADPDKGTERSFVAEAECSPAGTFSVRVAQPGAPWKAGSERATVTEDDVRRGSVVRLLPAANGP